MENAEENDKNKKKVLISCGKINKSLLYIILMSLFMVLNQYIYGFIYIECFYKMNIYKILYNALIDPTKKDFPRHRVFDPLFSYLGVIALSLFIPKVNKNNNNNNEDKDDTTIDKKEIKLIHNDYSDYLKNFKVKIIFIVTLILWVAEENLLLIYVDILQDLDFWFFELIFISIIFSWNFVFKIYSHQKFGMALSIIVGSLLKIYNITISIISTQKEEDKKFYQKYPFLCFFTIFYLLLIISRSYVNTYLKILMDLKFVSHRTLLMCYGLVGFIMCLLAGIFTSFVPCFDFINNYVCKINYDNKMYFDEFINYYESWKNILVRLIVIVLGMGTFFLNKFFYTLVIKKYTPIHVIFSFPIQFFIEKTFLLIFTSIYDVNQLFPEDNQLQKFLLDISGDVFSIFGFLIYLEMIELNFCGLNFNLEQNIINRGKSEYKRYSIITTEADKIKDEMYIEGLSSLDSSYSDNNA